MPENNDFSGKVFEKKLKSLYHLFIIVNSLLGIAHMLWPVMRWGQGRLSYFNFSNSQTLASWFSAMQLTLIAVGALAIFHRERSARKHDSPASTTLWPVLAGLALIVSLGEVSRFHLRLGLLGLPLPDLFQQLLIYSLWFAILGVAGYFVLSRLREVPRYFPYGVFWLSAWGLHLGLAILQGSGRIPLSASHVVKLLSGWAFLFGCSFLILGLGGYLLQPQSSLSGLLYLRSSGSTQSPWKQSSRGLPLLLVAGMTCITIFLQVLLFRMLLICADHLTAHSLIAVALAGIAAGGLIGSLNTRHSPGRLVVAASLLLPAAILLAFGATVSLSGHPLPAALLLSLPFICTGTVVTVIIVQMRSHVVYFVDLLGAALGAVLLGGALRHLREESGFLLLCSLACIMALISILSQSGLKKTRTLSGLTIVGILVFALAGLLNLKHDWLNVAFSIVKKDYPAARKVVSKSSFIGRYDVIDRNPRGVTVQAYENGRIIDNMRPWGEDAYQIDPRIPHTIIKDPSILVLGLSGDGVTKTAKRLGKEVVGIELNPVVALLQKNVLTALNGNSYRSIDVSVMDGRSYLEQSKRKFDMITLMNTHTARGLVSGRSASPEYLFTREAIDVYLEHLNENGLLSVEEPVRSPEREPPVWKMLMTMRRCLLDRGYTNPERHFFIFWWHTKTNDYVQLIMKANPLKPLDIENLKRWLADVDRQEELEAASGRRLGPIHCRTTLLYSPGENQTNIYSRIVRGAVTDTMIRNRSLSPVRDDSPFLFDVDPARSGVKRSYRRIAAAVLLILVLLFLFSRRSRGLNFKLLPFLGIVALTGIAYLLVEIVFINRYQVFLGSPTHAFATVLASLLCFSGLGSLWSVRLQRSGIIAVLFLIPVLLLLHQWLIPLLLPQTLLLPLAGKVALTAAVIAPLAFCMGIPFPYILKLAKVRFGKSQAAALFAVNGAAGALAVPLCLNLSLGKGFSFVVYAGIVLYVLAGLLLLSIPWSRFRYWLTGLLLTGLALLLIFPAVTFRLSNERGDQSGTFEVFAVNYGRSRIRENRLLLGGDRRVMRSFGWYFWLIKGGGRTILVDTGFRNAGLKSRWEISDYVDPVQRLQQLNISPLQVSDVILSHGHRDHIGTLSEYRNARVWLQRAEFARVGKLDAEGDGYVNETSKTDMELLRMIDAEGRLRLLDGDQTLVPGVSLILSSGHSPGSQIVAVETVDGTVCIAADECLTYRNNFWHIPIGDAHDPGANMKMIREMQRLAASPFYIIPGHDLKVSELFPAVSEGIVKIVPLEEAGR